MGVVELRTERCVLRDWRDADRDAYAALNADPVVMEHFPAPLTRAQSDEHLDRSQAGLVERGWGLWALEVPGVTGFAGFVGLAVLHFEAHFTPALEVGWRLDRAHWGQGYAPEAARECLRFAFDDLGRDEVVSITAVANLRSRRVMEKLGMTRDPAEDFDHPSVPPGSPVRHHVLYRLPAARWRAELSAAQQG